MTPQSLPEVHGRSDFKMQLVEMSPFYGSYIRATRCLHHDVIAFEYRHFREIQAVRTYEQRTTIRYQVSEISAFYPDCW